MDSTTKKVTLEPVDTESHKTLLKRWLQLPHVSKWWGDPGVRYQGFLETPINYHALIAVNQKPVGYLRWSKVVLEDLHEVGLNHIPEDAVDIDIFIADPDETGEGIGPQALKLLLDQLTQETSYSLAGICTSIKNHRAIKAFEKAGFKKDRVFSTPTYGECWLLTQKL